MEARNDLKLKLEIRLQLAAVCVENKCARKLTYRTKSCKAVRSTDEGVAVCHTKALLEDCAVTVGVNLEFHGH